MIIYVDDILIYGHNVKDIAKFIHQMKTEDFKLHKEGTAEGYLGVDIQQDGNTIIRSGFMPDIVLYRCFFNLSRQNIGLRCCSLVIYFRFSCFLTDC